MGGRDHHIMGLLDNIPKTADLIAAHHRASLGHDDVAQPAPVAAVPAAPVPAEATPDPEGACPEMMSPVNGRDDFSPHQTLGWENQHVTSYGRTNSPTEPVHRGPGPVQQMDGGMENYGGAGNRFCSATMGGSCSFQGDGPDAKCSSCQMSRAEKEGPAEQQATEQHHVYHERQEAALCAMHCINNLLQSPCCTVPQLAEIAEELDNLEKSQWRRVVSRERTS